jgi:outer membrane protein
MLAGPLHATDLKQVYQLALRSDPQLRAALASLRAARTQKPQARALFLPNITTSANSTWNQQDGTSSGDYNSNGYSLSLTQPVFHYDYFVRYRQAGLTIKKALADYSAADQALIVRVAERYFAVLSAEDNLRFTRADKKATKRQLEQARKRFEVGLIAITDVHEAKAAYDQTVASEIAAVSQLDSAREALQEITGRYLKLLSPLGKNVPLLKPDPASIEKWAETAKRQNLQLRSAMLNADIAQQNIRLQRSGHLPTLDLVAGRSKSIVHGGVFGARDTTTDSVSLQFSMSLFQGGLVVAKTREAVQLYRQARELAEAQRRATLRQARDAYRGVVNGISRIMALQQATVSSLSAYKATKAGFEVGTRTIVDVLNAQRELFRARNNYAQARYDYILNMLRLKQAAGTLRPQDLVMINGWLQ